MSPLVVWFVRKRSIWDVILHIFHLRHGRLNVMVI
jgi:hypothetical protein